MEFNICLSVTTTQFSDEDETCKIDNHISDILSPLCKSLCIELISDYSVFYKDDACEVPQYRIVYKLSRDVKNQRNLCYFVSLFESLARLFSVLPHVEDCQLEW